MPVCPTCFCTTVDDVTDLVGAEDRRERVWDSCFSADFSYLHGGAVRASTRSRYRQWATHKLDVAVEAVLEEIDVSVAFFYPHAGT